jgi:hypothetical protein
MKTIQRLILCACLIAGAAVSAIAGPGPQFWETLRHKSQFEELKPGDKIAYVCNQCQTVTEKTIASKAEAMELCQEGATVTCPACKKTAKMVLKAGAKPGREVTYVNDKGEECLFIVKLPAQK